MIRSSLLGKDKLVNALRGLANKVVKSALQEVWIAANDINNEMREPGKPIVYPVQWDSEKQRRAFFATDGFGRGIPTKRTGQGVGAWRAIKTENGADVFNPLSHIVFINGRRQSRIHRGRWKQFHLVVVKVFERLPTNLLLRLKATIEEQGFRTQ